MLQLSRCVSSIHCVCLAGTLALLLSPLSAQEPTGPGRAVDFGRTIRPLLADKCFSCHGLDPKHREGGLRLDVQDGLYGPADSGLTAVVPGKPAESSVYQRITAVDDQKMPPADSGKTLTEAEKQLIHDWIRSGAKWEQHWSLISPTRPAVPSAEGSSWPRNEIDQFILERLNKAGMQPSAEAEKTSLLRRVTFDLTGLPPTPDEIREFLADQSPNSYDQVVEKLLSSPHYGEHMARFWLDAARYGDTHGLHLDNYRVMWPYRDWVVSAFNENKPFDQFTTEQLAGDLLPDATQDQILATGFNRCNVTTSEGGALPEEYEVYYTNDRVATMSTVWMGISMGCVTCHESKFDPFEMKDFYQLYAFFNNLDGPVMDGNVQDTAPFMRVTSDEQRIQLASLDARIAELNGQLNSSNPEVDAAQTAWEASYRSMMDSPVAWNTLSPEEYSSARSAAFEKLEDQSLLISGTNASQDTYEVTGTLSAGTTTAIRLEGLIHPSLTEGGAGRSSNSNVVLSELEAEIAIGTALADQATSSSVEPAEMWQKIKLSQAWADHEQPDGDFKVANAIDGKPETGWAINGHNRREDRTAIFAFETPLKSDVPVKLKVRLRHESIFAQHQFGRIRLATTSADRIPQFSASSVPQDIAQIIRASGVERDEKQAIMVRDHYRTLVCNHPAIVSAREELATKKKERTDLEASLPISLVWRETPKPKPAYILVRGAYNKPGDEVFRNTPAALPPLTGIPAGATANRLDLAKWLLAPEHPLTARVTVNRFWQQFFGRGIVETSEDFGSQGSPPTHPELLDWMAVDFRESGWNIKQLARKIVTSATYRQSAVVSESALSADPGNELLARGPRYRMEAETIRDIALASSGLLVKKLGGPSVKPYQPEGIWEAVGYTDSNTAKFARDSGEALYRRSLYTFWKRTAPPPTMATFDAPSRETCTVRRPRTNTPLAALALMNDEQFVEASRAMGQRILKEGGASDESRIEYAFLLTLGRYPSPDEEKVIQGVLSESSQRYAGDSGAATKLISVGESKPDPTLDPGQLAAWTLVSNLMLNLDETITK
ncbi:MAG: PSD1 domain-containing protein [Planctomyces sp.]|nr:PSD1 domain-containing protein [Planctomyces sp.]